MKLAQHKDPTTGKTIKAKSWTQVVDRPCRFLKNLMKLKRLVDPAAGKNPSAQCKYVQKQRLVWVASGELSSRALEDYVVPKQ